MCKCLYHFCTPSKLQIVNRLQRMLQCSLFMHSISLALLLTFLFDSIYWNAIFPIMTFKPSPFHFRGGELCCEDIGLETLFNSIPIHHDEIEIDNEKYVVEVPPTPAFVYSTSAIQNNVETYVQAMKKCGLKGVLGYAVKANGNVRILKALKAYGVEMLVTVSGNEMLAGLKAGFDPNKILLNGNGKQSWEIKLAIKHGILLNVDSVFDAKRITEVAMTDFPQKKVRVFLRLRPSPDECDVGVHPFVNTADKSKFGFDLNELDQILECLKKSENISVIGVHCHLGSCITKPEVFTYLGTFISAAAKALEERGISIEFLDVGGGIGINYHKIPPGSQSFPSLNKVKNDGSEMHSIEEFMEVLSKVVPKHLTVLVEPGRSLIGDTGILVAKVLGSKEVRGKQFMVVDAAMSDLIRPCLYGSHHQIFPTKFNEDHSKWAEYDVVGPICESSDFLGKNILFQSEPDFVAIMDCGAYGASMSSTYNLRPKAAEILVNGTEWNCIRRRDTFDDLTGKYV